MKKELWNVLELVERFDSDASDITSSIRNLPSAKTPIGKARAWIRMALMKKKLADYFRILLNHKEDAMSDFYESDALMLSDEATIIGGLLVGLNIIDCNLCMKEEDLDSQTNIIDFSKYLRDNVISYELDDNLPDISNDWYVFIRIFYTNAFCFILIMSAICIINIAITISNNLSLIFFNSHLQ